jgi:hypothetical protein
MPRTALPGLIILLLALIPVACAHHPPAPAGAPTSPGLASASLADVDAAALQGDLREALRRLDQLPPDRLSGPDRARRDCLFRTFRDGTPDTSQVAGRFAPEVAAAYREYWTRVLLGEATREGGASELEGKLRALLARAGRSAPESATLDDVTENLGPLLLEDGYHSIRGVTLPFHELILWRRETPRTYQAPLPEGAVQVKVVFMEDFPVRGWAGYATCGRSFAGGWTTDEALFCVADAYDTSSEGFTVSYLAHEGQHFRDRSRFPAMEQPELEYRAKLVELALARTTTHALLAHFARDTSADRSLPHSHANRQVVTALSRALLGKGEPVREAAVWEALPAERISAAARALLLEDSGARAKSAGG